MNLAEDHLADGHYLIGDFRSTYAGCLLAVDRAAEAVPHALNGFEELRATLGPTHPYAQRAANTIIDIYDALGTPELAEPFRSFAAGE